MRTEECYRCGVPVSDVELLCDHCRREPEERERMSEQEHEKRVAEIKLEWSESVEHDDPNTLDDWPVAVIIATEDRLDEITTNLDAPEYWTRELVMLVGECVNDQKNGYDALASASWDSIVKHWNQRSESG